MIIDRKQLLLCGIDDGSSQSLIEKIHTLIKHCITPEQSWQILSSFLSASHYPFALHLYIFTQLFPTWREHPDTAPAWIPTEVQLSHSNIASFMAELNINNIQSFHQWTTKQYQDFWQRTIQKLNIVFKKKPNQICDLSKGVESPHWLPGGEINIADSCFTAPDSTIALIYEDPHQTIHQLSYKELNHLSNRVANSLTTLGYTAGDAIGIIMPMTIYAVAIYLGIIKIGGVVVSTADSFSSQEIAIRLISAKTKIVFTQDFLSWGGKELALYEKVRSAYEGKIVILPLHQSLSLTLTPHDIKWIDFLVKNTAFTSIPCHPMAACHILFSSGTTAQPKAIPWNHTTAIKAASDAYFHNDIKAKDVLCWPTNLGWMMGPWLIYAAFINHATIALYPDAPKDRTFGEFVEKAKVTMLGVVPTLVASWRQSQCMQGLNWQSIKLFSSSGECSNPEDMLYLMSLAHYKPIIEYCGGTEIGGAYISSTVIEKNYPSLFSIPTMGLDFIILDTAGKASDVGEVALIPPSMGLSVELLNADHHHIYFENMPRGPHNMVLRRHGDQIMRLPNGYYILLGRSDDTMNLSGIKISAAEIERTLSGIPYIGEVAAIAVSSLKQGPNRLVIYATTTTPLEKTSILQIMQKRINTQLNPLFKIYDLIFINELPKTASNKIMRRMLRDQYQMK
ncbi:MAG: hypothetical protein A3F42_06170 [Gammaproteobacteria bacterium RIFCSPHIGHO2_12_FULL_37_34]|nr:MAG: hypothetical protein A3F42_06170 [Gammaproteobacteria bacterium RIFCSPHIGHO2_12_FULL_37_34]